MPNWCFNLVTIEGSEEDIKRVKEQLNKPFSQPYKDWKTNEPKIQMYSNPVFAFWNIVCPPEDKYDLYHETNGWSNGVKSGDTPWNWYNFNNREWGTKWDVAVGDDAEYPETHLANETSTMLVYSFNTAWAPPIGALNKLSEQYPSLSIKNEWEEEQGFGATSVHKNGEDEEVEGYNWKCPMDHFFCGDTNDLIYDEGQGELICPTCEPDRYKKKSRKKVNA
jgi:Ferredoxin-like domain in Api92-like protein